MQDTKTDKDTKATTTYAQASLKKVIGEIDADKDGGVSRSEWRLAQRKDWFHIWLWPAIGAMATCFIFMIGFRDTHRSTDAKEPQEGPAESETITPPEATDTGAPHQDDPPGEY